MTAPSPSARRKIVEDMLTTADGRRALADELERVLFREVLDAEWPATKDLDCGGYLTDLDRRWRPAGPQSKSLEFIARHMRAYARAAIAYPGRGYDEAARHGFAFLTEHMWDAANGGFYTVVDRRGAPLEQGRKHPHGHLYVVDGAIAMAPLVGESLARDWAMRAFAWLEDVAWDVEHGGYWGYFERDNTRIRAEGKKPWEGFDWIGSPLETKDFNVLGDALATVNGLATTGWANDEGAKTGVGDRAAARLIWHTDLFLDRLLPLWPVTPFLYTRDWRMAPDILRAGQVFQVIAALLEAAANTGRWDEAMAGCCRLRDTAERFFAHRDGGFVFAKSVYEWPLRGADLTARERSWWVQTEAARGGLLLALLKPEDAGRRAAFARQWVFIEQQLIDPRFHGFYESAEQGHRWRRHWLGRAPSALNKLNMWKDASHETHLLMDASDWLRHGPDCHQAGRIPQTKAQRETAPV